MTVVRRHHGDGGCLRRRKLLRDVEVRPVRDAAERQRWDRLVSAHHDLPFRGLCGHSPRHVAVHGDRRVALLGWTAEAFKVGARDRWIDWIGDRQFRRLKRIANNADSWFWRTRGGDGIWRPGYWACGGCPDEGLVPVPAAGQSPLRRPSPGSQTLSSPLADHHRRTVRTRRIAGPVGLLQSAGGQHPSRTPYRRCHGLLEGRIPPGKALAPERALMAMPLMPPDQGSRNPILLDGPGYRADCDGRWRVEGECAVNGTPPPGLYLYPYRHLSGLSLL